MIQKLAHLSPAFAHQRDHDDIRGSSSSYGTEQRTLPDPGSGEETDALPLAERQKGVDRPHACRDGGVDGASVQGARRIAVDGNQETFGRRAAVECAAETVDDPSRQGVARADLERTAGRFDSIMRTDPGERAERHRDRLFLGKPDDLAGKRLTPPPDVHDIAHPYARQREAESQSGYAEDASGRPECGCRGEPGLEGLEIH